MPPAIIMAPLSNAPLRDWPAEHYGALALLCIERLDAQVTLVGTPEQRGPVDAIARDLPAGRLRNLCGATGWDAVERLLSVADCVVANNSGVAHLAARLGVPTVCVFAASHSPYEWMPRGRAVITLVKRTACSPCGIARLSECRFGHRCMHEIAPATVFDAVRRAIMGVPAVGERPSWREA